MASKKIQFKLTAVDKTKAAFDKVSKSLKTVGGGAMKAAKLIGGIGLAAVGAAAGLAILVKKSFEYIDTLGKTAARTGIATDTLQAFQLAALESGSTIEQTQKGLEKFARSIGDAGRGLKTQADIFKDLDVDLKNTDGTLRTFEEILNDTADGLMGLGSEAERATVLANLFGRAGLQFSEVFRGGSDQIKDFTKRANELGLILSDKTIKNVEKFNDSMAVVKLQLGAAKNQIFAAFVPALQVLSTKLSETLKDANAAAGGFEQLGIKVAVGVMEGFVSFASGVGSIIDFIRKQSAGMAVIATNFRLIMSKTALHFKNIRQSLFGIFEDISKEVAAAKLEVKEAELAFDEAIHAALNIESVGDKVKVVQDFIESLKQKIKEGGVEFEGFTKNTTAGLEDNLSALQRFKDGITGKNGLTDSLDNVAIGSMKKFEDTIVEGLKTGKFAFKDFATYVVEQLIRVAIQQLIVARLVDPFRGLFGFTSSSTSTSTSSSGGGGGGLGFDGGGFTGMGARTGGVDGKGGFPAILHPNETVIDHTKGQGMGATVNFNISTVDAASFDELLASRKGLITSIINNAMNNQGKMGVV